MKTIFKFNVVTTDRLTIPMPSDAKILTVQMQNECPYIWAIVETNNPIVDRKFSVYGTGHQMSEYADEIYIGTYQLQGGALVFHLFEYIGEYFI